MEQTQEFWKMLLGGNSLVPLVDDPNALFVDANCRFGEYAIELAREYPHTPVIGIGREYHSPIGRPINCRLVVENVATGTTFGANSCRFIQSRDVALTLRREQWLPYLSELYRMLEIGGYLQVLEVSVWRKYAQEQGGGYKSWSERLFPALAEIKGVCVVGLETLNQVAAEAGFSEIVPIHIRIPVGQWPNTQLDPSLVEAGKLLRQNLLYFVDASRPLLRSIMFSELTEAEIMMACAKGELYDDNLMACHDVYGFIARKT